MNEPTKRVALVCTNYTMQSAFGLLILALNSARLGYETLIYFTFEGLKMIQPGGMENLLYLPTGVVGDSDAAVRYTAQLRETMDRKDIPFVEDMLEMAQLEGVRMLACKTSADLFNLDSDNFIEGVQIMVAEEFMKAATSADLHMTF
jgi:predicted peroxiredoxin